MLSLMASTGHVNDQESGSTEMEIKSRESSFRYHVHNGQPVHKVGIPPKQNLLEEFTSTLKETFFADDPLRHFKDQPRSRKFVLGVQAVFPILDWVRNYNFRKFKGDLIAGLTIASLCIPQVLQSTCCIIQ